MKKRSFVLMLVPVMLLLIMTGATFSLSPTAHAAALDDPNPSGTPDNLRVPDNEVLVWDGVTEGLVRDMPDGAQVYECLPSGDGYAWTFIGPKAHLVNPNRPEDGIYHGPVSFGPNPVPQWVNLADGSSVQGSVIQRAPGQPGAIAMLLLQSVGNSNAADGTPGLLGNVNYIQRLDTSGGVAPSDTCDADNNGQDVYVPYSAHYYLYAPAQ